MDLSWYGKQSLNSSYNQQSYDQYDIKDPSNRNHISQRRMSLNQTPSFKHYQNDNQILNNKQIDNDIAPKSVRTSSRYDNETSKNNYFQQFKEIMQEYPQFDNKESTDQFLNMKTPRIVHCSYMNQNSQKTNNNISNQYESIQNPCLINEKQDQDLMSQLDWTIQLQNKIYNNQLKNTLFHDNNRENQNNLRNLLIKNQQYTDRQVSQQTQRDDTLKIPRLTSELSIDKSNYAQSSQYLEIRKDSTNSKVIEYKQQNQQEPQIKIPTLKQEHQQLQFEKEAQNIKSNQRYNISIDRQTTAKQRISNSKRYHLKCISQSFNIDPKLQQQNNSNKSSPIKNKKIQSFKQNQINMQDKINLSVTKVNNSEKKISELENRIHFLENKMNDTSNQVLDKEDQIQYKDVQDSNIDNNPFTAEYTNPSLNQIKTFKGKEIQEPKSKDEMVEDILQDVKIGKQENNSSSTEAKNNDFIHQGLNENQKYELDRFIGRVQKQIGDLSYSDAIQKFYDFESRYQKELSQFELKPSIIIKTLTQQDTKRLSLNKQQSKASSILTSIRQSKNNIESVSNKNTSFMSNVNFRQANKQKSQK